MKKFVWITAFVVATIVTSSFIQIPPKEEIKWLTLTELQTAYSKQPRPILFDIYTNWCGWCKVMDRETYQKDKVVAYINNRYYAVKFNAESRDPVILGNKKFDYIPEYKANGLAVYLMGGQMSFPTTVFLSTIDAQPAPLAGFLKPAELEAPLKFFGDKAFKTQNYQEYMRTFSGSW